MKDIITNLIGALIIYSIFVIFGDNAGFAFIGGLMTGSILEKLGLNDNLEV